MASYIITTILLVIVLSIQSSKQNFGLWKFIIILCLCFVVGYDITSILKISMGEHMITIWVGTIVVACLGMLILLIGEEKSYTSISKDENLKM